MALRIKETLTRIFQPSDAPAGLAVPETPEEGRNRRTEPRKPSFETVLVEWDDLEKGTQAFAGRLENRSPKGLGIRGPRLIPRGKTILVSTEEESSVKAVVRHCAAGLGGFYLGAEVILHDKRRSDREPMHFAAEISCTRGGRRDDLPVIIRDASDTGLQLESPEPLAEAEVIEISYLGSYRQGTVAHCRRLGESYRIGVQFIGPARAESRG